MEWELQMVNMANQGHKDIKQIYIYTTRRSAYVYTKNIYMYKNKRKLIVWLIYAKNIPYIAQPIAIKFFMACWYK